MAKKVTKKNTEKTILSDVVLNLTEVETPNDLIWEATVAKIRGGKPITEEEFNTSISIILGSQAKLFWEMALAASFMSEPWPFAKKTPWYKKLWNKITGLFKKK